MDAIRIINYRNLRLAYWFLLITAGVYFSSSLVVFLTDVRLANYFPQWEEESSAVQPKTMASVPPKEYKSLLERNLFGVKADESRKDKSIHLLANLDKLALTSLNCTLVGTIINESGEPSAVIRDNQSNKEEKVSVGSVYSGAKVILILRNKVVLNFNGKDELLVMGIERIRAENLAKEQPAKAEGAGDISTFKISKDFIAQSVTDLPKLMATVRIRPFMKDGKPQGFKVSNLKEGSLLKTMGFHDDDVIKSVNGQDIHSPEDVMKLYNTLKDSNFFTISILRNNQSKTLNYKVR
jgi:general secretion pathway protein C